MAQQTAVEWLLKQINKQSYSLGDINITINVPKDIIEQAKQMEKEQIQDAWHDGNFLGRNGNILADYSDGKGYYQKEFENK